MKTDKLLQMKMEIKKIEAGKDPNVNTIQGLLQSWYDAPPGGFSEEMREFYYSIGTEYWYNKAFAVRAGYLGT